MRPLWVAVAGCCSLVLAGCKASSSGELPASIQSQVSAAQVVSSPRPSQVRASGTIQAVHAYTVQVPRIEGLVGRLTLVTLVPNGTEVKEGDLLAEFDNTSQLDAAREAQARFEDLSHQVKQKMAQNRVDAEKRRADLAEAEADLAKAEILLRKGPILAEIDRLKNEAKAESARAKVQSLQRMDQHRRQAEAAALRMLELQMERQKVALERAQRNSQRMELRAPIAGMIALENLWREGSMGNAQEGDQLGQGQGLLKIFDPREMEVLALVAEPDGAILREGATALVVLDAYPDTVFRARFHSASPVATAALGSPIKTFPARFRLEQSDPRLLPDLSAAAIISLEDTP